MIAPSNLNRISGLRYITTTAFTSSKYGGTWKNTRRVQNPAIAENMPTYEFVTNNNNFKKTRLVYICGLGITGSLGLPKFYKPEKKDPEELTNNCVSSKTFRRLGVFSASDKISDVACGHGFTLVAGEAKGSSHTLFGFGLNSYSQLGYHSNRPGYPLEIVSTPSPVVVPTKAPIVKVACGRSHTIMVNAAGQVYSMGNNSLGQCGRPIKEKEEYFGSKIIHEVVELPDNISQIECGQDHSMFLTDDGKLFTCGWGADGQTGLGHYDVEHSPKQVKGDIEQVKVVKVSSYADTVLALDSEGNVFGWGNTEYAQFRTLTGKSDEQFNTPRYLKLKGVPGKIVDVAAGGTVCAILNDRGQVYVWGFGILGLGPKVDQSSEPTLIPETLFGMNIYNPYVKVEQIHASLSHFAAISNQGDLYTWGRNRGNSLGFSHANNQFFPMRVNINLAVVKKVALGVDHTCVIAEKVC